ncbi:MAG: beta-propeller fold lactonase family protein [Magnetococcales bacterium]|nr:beta-propeller fold lactonase family protein [Magnetococcales bacterium]
MIPFILMMAASGASGGAGWDLDSFNNTGRVWYSDTVTNGESLSFNTDGTKVYVFSTADVLHQFSLNPAWDLSSISYDSVSLDVSATTDGAWNMRPSADGTIFYIWDNTTGKIHEWSLSTAWDLSTASFSQTSGSITWSGNVRQDIRFKTDGTKMYLMSKQGPHVIYQYSLSTAWDSNTSSYDSKSLDYSSQTTLGCDFTISSDGTKVFVIDGANSAILQYDLSTAWDISTASYASKSYSTNFFDTNPYALEINSDGTKMYVTGAADHINALTLSTANDISTASYDQEGDKKFSIATQTTNCSGFFIGSDGTKLYVADADAGNVYQYTLSTAWDVSTASYDSKSYSVSTQETTPRGVFFKDDGTKMYVIGTLNDSVYQYTLSTAWDVSTASYDSKSYSVSTQETTPYNIYIKSDGTKFYVVGNGTDSVYQYSLSTAWDISTASYDSKSKSIATEDSVPTGIFFKSDGTKMFIGGLTGDSVIQYTLSTAWDVSTASYDSKELSTPLNPYHVFFKADGSSLYVVSVENYVHQFDII